jgi:spermidine synthase
MVLVIATAGLVYELAIAAVASYLLGDSVRQFSLIIGVYLSAMGLGAYLSRFVTEHVAWVFVDVELGAALIGGFSAPALFLAFSYTDAFTLLLYSIVVVVGALVGLELPLLIRVLERHVSFKDLIAKALTFDYAGALIGSLGFSLLLVPFVGLLRSTLLCGVINAAIALLSTWVLPRLVDSPSRDFFAARLRAGVVLLVLLVALPFADRALEYSERSLYPGRITHREQSSYQRIVLTQGARGFELYLNGNLQFASRDEAIYHEALVHPGFFAAPQARRVLIGGGGDGLAAREVLKWPNLESLVLVDLDPAVTRLGREHPALRELNQNSLHDPRVTIINQDAMVYVARGGAEAPGFDLVLLDFPDPSNYAVGKLYSDRFYRSVARRLNPGGAVVVQASSPLLARKTFWCTVTTLEAAGFTTQPYHAFVPSFGEWGFVLATLGPNALDRTQAAGLALASGVVAPTLTPASLEEMFEFPRDTRRVEVPSNRLDTQQLVRFYLEEWSRVN